MTHLWFMEWGLVFWLNCVAQKVLQESCLLRYPILLISRALSLKKRKTFCERKVISKDLFDIKYKLIESIIDILFPQRQTKEVCEVKVFMESLYSGTVADWWSNVYCPVDRQYCFYCRISLFSTYSFQNSINLITENIVDGRMSIGRSDFDFHFGDSEFSRLPRYAHIDQDL